MTNGGRNIVSGFINSESFEKMRTRGTGFLSGTVPGLYFLSPVIPFLPLPPSYTSETYIVERVIRVAAVPVDAHQSIADPRAAAHCTGGAS